MLRIVLLTLLVCSVATAQSPAYQPPEQIAPDLPNVLLIGDSISIGYMLDTRKELEGVANVFRPPTNCGPTTRGLEQIDKWLGDRKWDVIHWNHGLHDLKYVGSNGENLADPDSEGAHQQVPIEQYKENLRKLAERLKKTGATIIWCETTPVPEGSAGRIAGDAKRYNEAAAEVMAEVGGITTNQLYDFAIKHKDLQRPKNVHYTPKGSAKLAEQVARSVKAAIKKD
jgi:hypothetical protein